jgi:hypothetical protein
LTAVAGDTGDTRTIRLDGIADLTGVTAIEAYVWKEGDKSTRSTLTCSVADATARTVTVNLGAGGGWLPTARPGSYFFEIEATFGTVIRTWPEGTPDTILVRASGD